MFRYNKKTILNKYLQRQDCNDTLNLSKKIAAFVQNRTTIVKILVLMRTELISGIFNV